MSSCAETFFPCWVVQEGYWYSGDYYIPGLNAGLSFNGKKTLNYDYKYEVSAWTWDFASRQSNYHSSSLFNQYFTDESWSSFKIFFNKELGYKKLGHLTRFAFNSRYRLSDSQKKAIYINGWNYDHILVIFEDDHATCESSDCVASIVAYNRGKDEWILISKDYYKYLSYFQEQVGAGKNVAKIEQ
jgi:hypothetical protein